MYLFNYLVSGLVSYNNPALRAFILYVAITTTIGVCPLALPVERIDHCFTVVLNIHQCYQTMNKHASLK